MKSLRSGARLSEEDRILWNLVARTTKPLDPRRKVEEDEELLPAVASPAAPEPVRPPTGTEPAPSGRQRVSPVLDRPTLDRLARGRLQIEGRVDLHGLSQERAHHLLFDFLRRAQVRGVRYVLVITGKGSGGEGILRRQVPVWLSTPPFRAIVSSHDQAARQHGGSGALYVRLRRLGQDK